MGKGSLEIEGKCGSSFGNPKAEMQSLNPYTPQKPDSEVQS